MEINKSGLSECDEQLISLLKKLETGFEQLQANGENGREAVLECCRRLFNTTDGDGSYKPGLATELTDDEMIALVRTLAQYLKKSKNSVESLTTTYDDFRSILQERIRTFRSENRQKHREELDRAGADSESMGRLVAPFKLIAYAEDETCFYLTFPPIEGNDQCSRLIVELGRFYDRFGGGKSWWVDMSQIKEIPLMMLGALISHNLDFEKLGRPITLWRANIESLPPQEQRLLRVKFRLLGEESPHPLREEMPRHLRHHN